MSENNVMQIPILKHQVFLVVLIACFAFGCGPKVYFFHILPNTTIAESDSVRFTWKVRGTPALLHYQQTADDPDNPQKKYAFYKLVAKKGKKEAAFPTLGLTILPDTSIDYIFINTVKRNDSLIANGVLDTLVWGRHFLIQTVTNPIDRPMTIVHGGKKTIVSPNMTSTAYAYLPNSGPWLLGVRLTSKELLDSTLIPARLRLKTVIIHP